MTTKPPSGSGMAAESIEDSIEDILIDAVADKPPAPVLAKTPAPEAAGTPGPVLTKTPAPVTKTPGPAAGTRDPSSALPTIPPARKEPSGAFPLPGMAPLGDAKPSDEDSTLIARLSVLDDLVEESTKVEPLEEAENRCIGRQDRLGCAIDRPEPVFSRLGFFL